jgi:hypothetical protein
MLVAKKYAEQELCRSELRENIKQLRMLPIVPVIKSVNEIERTKTF